MTTATAPDVSSGAPTSAPFRDRSRVARRVLIYLLAAFILITLFLWRSGALRPQPKVALVTASSGQYWDLISQGARDAANRYHVHLTLVHPKADEPSQTQAIEGLLGTGLDGVAISPNDPPRQAAVLARIASEMPLVTYDSDCPVAAKL